MLHSEIQKGKEAMKTSEFQKDIRWTAACMKRLSMDTKRFGQLTSNETYFTYSWFSFVKTAEEAMAARFNYWGPVKTIHKGFCLATLGNLMKYWTRRSYIVMGITPRVPSVRPLMAMVTSLILGRY